MKIVNHKTGIISYGKESYSMPIREILSEIEEKKNEEIVDIFEFVADIKDVDYLVDKYFNINVRHGDRIIITVLKK